MSHEFQYSLKVFFCGVIGVFLIFQGFKQLGKRHAENLLRSEFEFLKYQSFDIKDSNYFRGDYVVEMRSDTKSPYRWTFNRTTGELIPWGTRESQMQKKTGVKQ